MRTVEYFKILFQVNGFVMNIIDTVSRAITARMLPTSIRAIIHMVLDILVLFFVESLIKYRSRIL